MAEEGQVIESAAAPEVQAEAQKMGWIPPERYKGDPEKFIDADKYIENGQVVLPILRSKLAEKDQQLGKLHGKVAELEQIVSANQESMSAMEKYHKEDLKRKVEQARSQLKREIAQAAKDGDHEALAEATDQLAKLGAEDGEVAEAKPAERKPPTQEQLPPYMREWMQENSWYGSDRRRTALANGIAEELRQKEPNLIGRAFLDEVVAQLEEVMPSRQKPSSEKVGGSRGGARGANGGKSFADLPAEAKEACDRFAKQLVGKGRRYEKLEDWRKKYAADFFSEA